MNDFELHDAKANVVTEVGRDPLRPPADTPAEQIVYVARELAAARLLLEKVLPSPVKKDT